MRRALLATVLFVVAASAVAVSPAAADDLDYQAPIDAPIVDHFRPPAAKWAAGNRGIDYQTTAGTPVTAAEEGRVEFAGQVGGTLHVVVRHPDGLRTSYSFLASIAVVEGQTVSSGTIVGTAGDSLHFGVRSGDTYIDPELVLRGAAFSVHLVPAEGETEAQRRLGEMLRDAVVDELLSGEHHGGFTSSVVSWLRSTADPAAIIRLAVHYSAATSVTAHLAGFGAATWRWYRSRSSCTASGDVGQVLQQPASDHLVILIAGFGSASTPGAGVDLVDLTAAGISADHVMRFSYNGGRTPTSTGAPFAALETTTYTSADSQAALEAVASRLADAVAAVAAANPGAPIDVIGHSQGGVVALRGLQIAASRGTLPAGTHLVTIASPHRGDTARDRCRSALTRSAARGRARRRGAQARHVHRRRPRQRRGGRPLAGIAVHGRLPVRGRPRRRLRGVDRRSMGPGRPRSRHAPRRRRQPDRRLRRPRRSRQAAAGSAQSRHRSGWRSAALSRRARVSSTP